MIKQYNKTYEFVIMSFNCNDSYKYCLLRIFYLTSWPQPHWVRLDFHII